MERSPSHNAHGKERSRFYLINQISYILHPKDWADENMKIAL